MLDHKALSIAAVSLLALSTSAFAGDMDGFNWTGPYIGLHAGYAEFLTHGDQIPIIGPDFTDTARNKGAIVGGQVGFNYQVSNFLLGIEGDASYLTTDGVDIALKDTYSVDYDWFATVRARAGLVQDNFLFYGTGGLALTELQTGIGDSGVITGFALGGGVEYKMSPAWSIKGEFLHADFENVTKSDRFNNDTTFEPEANIWRLGINWHF